MTTPGENIDSDSNPAIVSADVNPPIVDASIVSDEREIVSAEVVDLSELSNSRTTGSVALENIVDAELVGPPLVIAEEEPKAANSYDMQLEPTTTSESVEVTFTERPLSWVFRLLSGVSRALTHSFGIVSVIFLLAVAASIPIIQLVSFGYLLEVSGRLARRQSFRDAMIGLNKASKLGGIVLGTWLTLLPIRFVSELWHESYLIDPTSSQTTGMRIAQVALIALALTHIAMAWSCGGKLRYFFWPIIAPCSFSIWLVRRIAGASVFRSILNVSVGWMSPHLVNDICNAKPIGDWFVPAILFKQIKAGNLYARMRDSVWDFAVSLNLPSYFMLGLKGFVGSFAWLLLPTVLLVAASYTEGGTALLTGIFGVLFAIPIFMMLPFLQTHYAKEGTLKSFLEVRAVFKNFGRAPLAHISALLLTVVLALPLFFLKIEQIPSELLWTLSVVFIMFSWPARMSVGWAYRRGVKRESPTKWWLRYPVFFLAAPVALSFALIFTLTRYVSWNGAMSLYENHVFLLPAPFWMM